MVLPHEEYIQRDGVLEESRLYVQGVIVHCPASVSRSEEKEQEMKGILMKMDMGGVQAWWIQRLVPGFHDESAVSFR
jgi:hypothetical protein